MNNCSTCKWWINDENNYNEYDYIKYDINPVTGEKIGLHKVKECQNPKLVFYETPSKDGACVVDGSQYKAELLTGPNFGCVNHEE